MADVILVVDKATGKVCYQPLCVTVLACINTTPNITGTGSDATPFGILLSVAADTPLSGEGNEGSPLDFNLRVDAPLGGSGTLADPLTYNLVQALLDLPDCP